MSVAVFETYKTLTVEAQKEVEHLINFLASQQKKQSSLQENKLSELESFVGKCNSWKNEDALSYQNTLRKEERV